MKKKIVIIVGPTGSGKSELAIDLAITFAGEIINADSMQIYRFMDIGTCKVPVIERKVPHHLIDIIEPDREYNASQFETDAQKSIEDVISREKLPILVGGTGLYIKCLLGGMFKIDQETKNSRDRLLARIESEGLNSLYSELREVDPIAAAKIKETDKQRIVRALEIYRTTGKKISDLQKAHGFSGNEYEPLIIGMKIEREALKARLKSRTIDMYGSGLLQEVETLLDKGYKGTLNSLKSIGYKEALLVLQGKLSKEKALEITYKRTKDYAKRQMTWFRKNRDVAWFDPLSQKSEIELAIRRFLV